MKKTIDFTRWEEVKETIRPHLYNKKTAAEVSVSAADYGFDDLIIVPVVEFGGGWFTKVTESLIKAWGVARSDVFKAAAENAKDKFEIRDLSEMIPVPAMSPFKILVVTNRWGINYGAYGIIPKRNELIAEFPNGYIAIPSSVHEFLVVPREAGDDSTIRAMINEVNTTVVNPDEWLGDHPYFF